MAMRDWVAKVVSGGAEKTDFSRFPFLAKTQASSRKRWRQRGRLTVEPLEPRLLLNVSLTPGQYTLLDNSAAAATGSVLVDGSSTVTSVTVTTHGPSLLGDYVTALQINLPSHGSPGTYIAYISLSEAGITTSAPTVTFNSNLMAGDDVIVKVFDEKIVDGPGANFQNPYGYNSGFTATTYNMDSTYTGPVPTSIAAGTNFSPTGDIGDEFSSVPSMTIGPALGGADIEVYNYALDILGIGGNVGIVSLTGGLALTSGPNEIYSEALGTGTPTDGGVTITGAVTLGGNNLTVKVEDQAHAAATDPIISIAAPSTIDLGGGILSIDTAVAASPVGQVTLGNVTDITTGHVQIGNTADTTIFSAGITVGNITDNSTAGGYVRLDAASIAGVTSVGAFSATGTGAEDGYLYINDAGAAAGGIRLGELDLGSSASDNGSAYVIVTVGTSVGVTGGLSGIQQDNGITSWSSGYLGAGPNHDDSVYIATDTLNDTGDPIAGLSLSSTSPILIAGTGSVVVNIGGSDRTSGVTSSAGGATDVVDIAGADNITLSDTGNLEFTTSGGVGTIPIPGNVDLGGITETNDGSLIFDTGTGSTGAVPGTGTGTITGAMTIGPITSGQELGPGSGYASFTIGGVALNNDYAVVSGGINIGALDIGDQATDTDYVLVSVAGLAGTADRRHHCGRPHHHFFRRRRSQFLQQPLHRDERI